MSRWRPLRADESDEPRRVGESLDRFARTLGVPAASALGTVFARWEDVVGAAIAAHARPLSLIDGVLVVSVDEPAWATQLRFVGADLVARLNEAAATAAVERLEVRVRRR